MKKKRKEVIWLMVLCAAGCRAQKPFLAHKSFISEQAASFISPNLASVKQVETLNMDYAVAAWWGFREEDSTAFLQAAVSSGAKFLLIPNMGKPWITGPIELHGNQHILFEPGTIVEAKKGSFLGQTEALFSIINQDNITIEGRGATLRMRKEDYTRPPYALAEWRHCLTIRGSRNITVLGLNLENSGGDGIYIGRGLDDPERVACQDITIKHCAARNNHRQGMSVISVINLLVESCRFVGTQGTKPMTGIDFEPNRPDEPLRGIIVRDCLIENNAGGGVQFWLDKMSQKSGRVQAMIEGCTIRDNGWWGIQIHGLEKDDSPNGSIRFNNNSISGLKLVWKHSNTKITFK